MASGGKRLTVDGYTFWRAVNGGQAVELTTATGIELDADGCRWIVSPPDGGSPGVPVESASWEVRHFVSGVLGTMQRITRQATVRPAPKPTSKPAAPVPPTAPVPCPLCRGEAWPDCEVCDGAGYVTQRRAAEWRETHDV